ncbi:MAG: DUF72 domain-containing protein [Syntrophobacteraceae bacterium]
MDGESENTFNPERFLFRGLHPSVSLGTASDRYKGWIGQIYSEELYSGRITSRSNRVGKGSFREEVLPIDSVREYFQHFRVLEIDYTFYAPLANRGKPTPGAGTLGEYARYMGPGDRVFLKTPQMFFARKVWRGKEYVPNENYLAPEAFTAQFYRPAVDLLGPNLKGFIFEQEYQRKTERVPPEDLASELDAFFSSVPRDSRHHVELRTEAYLCEPVFDVLRKHGIGQVLSHWTWLPDLGKQLARAGGGFIDAGGQTVIRLMTPLGTRYEDAYAKAFPFDRLIEGMLQPAMAPRTAELMWEAVGQGKEVNVLINNRSGGNAPLIARQLAMEFTETRKRKDPG